MQYNFSVLTDLLSQTIKLILNGLLTSDSVKYLNIANNKKIKANGFKYVAIYMREVIAHGVQVILKFYADTD
jgi:predicted peroxiredoxin